MTDLLSTIPPTQDTTPEVFILESLDEEDEEDERYEGRILTNVLRFCGKDPIYRYFRTKKELRHFAKEFRSTGYRFLHISCHGDASGLCLSHDHVPIEDFSKIFENKLKNRRLFLSACEAGDSSSAEQIGERNPGMYSFLAPHGEIGLNRSLAVWTAFYVKLFAVDTNYVKNTTITRAIRNLCSLFKVSFSWSYHDSVAQQWKHETLTPRRPRRRNTLQTPTITETTVLGEAAAADINVQANS